MLYMDVCYYNSYHAMVIVCCLWGLVSWDIITVAMVMLLEVTFNFCMLLCRSNALKQKTVHSSMACYIHVLLYNAVNMFTC
jgi:hypothetical protein